MVVPAGTLIVVELTEPLSAATAKSGDRFGIRLAEPIVIDGVTILPAGALGQGEVIDAKPAGIGGRPGRLVLAARYLEIGDTRLKLQSLKLGGGGQDNSALATTAVMAIGLVGALIPGGGVAYPAGTHATAKVAAEAPATTAPPIQSAAPAALPPLTPTSAPATAAPPASSTAASPTPSV